MSESKLFPRDQVVGIFRGFSQGGLEFRADLVLPYRPDFQTTPMHGLFLLVQLENEREAVLGRITSFWSEGRLASGAGEDYGIRAVLEERVIPDDLREQYLKYRVNIRVLGVVRVNGNGPKEKIVFAASHRRLPHVGSKVARLSPDILRELAGHNDPGAPIGFYALGEFVYGGEDARLSVADWMRVCQPDVVPRFDIKNLVSRRSFIFARAGYGKSNLNKLLFSTLYGGDAAPTISKGGRDVAVGTVLFDPEGEYFWPDDRGRPGICDVPGVESRLVLFTARENRSAFYQSFVAGQVRLDIRRLRPADVVAIALSPEKQDQQNVAKLRSMPQDRWIRLVNEVHKSGYQTSIDLVCECIGIQDGRGEVEAGAALNNMTRIVKMLHDPHSQMLDLLMRALRDGCLCVVDVSQLRGEASFVLSGILLQKIFDHNQEHFTSAQGKTIPTIMVVEEAQTVLGAKENSSAMRPYIEWVKEGRKYDLGAVLVTQRPGSISDEILSQGDNWFIFHLLSARDLNAVRVANAHFSDDLLSSLLNEPIKGQGIFWSSESLRPFPIPIRVLDFGKLYEARDPDGTASEGETWVRRNVVPRAATGIDQPRVGESPPLFESGTSPPGVDPTDDEREEEFDAPGEGGEDHFTRACNLAIERVFADRREMEILRTEGRKWGRIMYLLIDQLPEEWVDRKDRAFELVKTFLERKFGRQGVDWHTVPRDGKAFIRIGPEPEDVEPQA